MLAALPNSVARTYLLPTLDKTGWTPLRAKLSGCIYCSCTTTQPASLPLLSLIFVSFIPSVMQLTLGLILCLLSHLVWCQSITDFWTVARAHQGSPTCPPAPGGTWKASFNDYGCCYTVTVDQRPSPTPNAATMVKLEGQSGYGCCPIGYTCTGDATLSDWITDNSGKYVFLLVIEPFLNIIITRLRQLVRTSDNSWWPSCL